MYEVFAIKQFMIAIAFRKAIFADIRKFMADISEHYICRRFGKLQLLTFRELAIAGMSENYNCSHFAKV